MIIKAGSANQTIYVSLFDSSSTTGAKKTGLTYASSGLAASYTRNGAAATAISVVTQTATGAWTSGGFAEVNSTNSPGLYRLDLPNAVVATGANTVIVSLTAGGTAGFVDTPTRIELVNYDPSDGQRLGLLSLPNANANFTSGLNVISGTKNVASTFDFIMIDNTTGQGATGQTVTVTIYQDGVSGTAAGTVTELGNGAYSYAATAADLNANRILFMFNASGCYTQTISISTK